MSNKNAIISHRYILFSCTFVSIKHFTVVKHTAAAMNNHFVWGKGQRKFCTAGENKFWIFACILFNPARQLHCSDIITLTMMSTAFTDKNVIAILYVLQSFNTSYCISKTAFIRAKRMEKDVKGIEGSAILATALKA